jgi:biopolymer transport protein ExbB
MQPLFEFFEMGGIFMYPLLFCSIVGLTVILERIFTIHRAKINVKIFIDRLIKALKTEGVEAAVKICENTKGPISAILHAGLKRAHKGIDKVEKAIESAATVEMSLLERGLVILSSVSSIAPLLGFLGTVSGMIGAFKSIALAEDVSPKLVATGIYEALITTATGLIIALPCLAFYNYFVHQIDKFVIEMEETSFTLIDNLIDLEVKRKD